MTVSEQNEVKPAPKTNAQATPSAVPIGIDRGKSPVEDLATEISASEMARKWAGKE